MTERILDEALLVFVRQGFRKTSMEDIAQAAGVSRQGLYLHFKNKEEVLGASIKRALTEGQAAVSAILGSDGSIEDRLLNALDEWFGRHVGLLHPDASDLVAHCERHVGNIVSEGLAVFRTAIESAIRESRVQADDGTNRAETIADLLCTCAGAWKYNIPTRSVFVDKLRKAILLCCQGLTKQ